MNSIIELNQARASHGTDPAPLASVFLADDLLPAHVSGAQQLLFGCDPHQVCQEIGLNWFAALKLHEDGWLSFSPEATPQLDEAQEHELRFVGTLVAAGCDRNLLQTLLAQLPKPCAYRMEKMYFDWANHRWRLLPEIHPHPETVFADWLEELIQKGDLGSLGGIAELAHDAISRVHGTHPK